jgi:hypothetical protein
VPAFPSSDSIRRSERASVSEAPLRVELQSLAAVQGASLSGLPQMSVLHMAIVGMASEVDDRKLPDRNAVRRTNTQL